MPTISVIVPVYKVDAYLRACVDSILIQTFSDFELILVNDGSPDGCGAICDEYAKQDKRVYVIHQENRGLSAARNAGIDWAFANSDSEWLAFVDSDDTVSPYYLERMYQAATKENADLCVCDFVKTFPDGSIDDHESGVISKVTTGRTVLEQNLIYDSYHYVIACNKLYKKSLFRSIRFPVGYIHEDEAIIHRILGAAETVVCISDNLYNYLQRTNSIMGVGRTVKSTDCLRALADRVLFADCNLLNAFLERSLLQFRNSFWDTCLPLIKKERTQTLYVKRTAKSVRMILSYALKSKVFTFGMKARMLFFGLAPRLYLALF